MYILLLMHFDCRSQLTIGPIISKSVHPDCLDGWENPEKKSIEIRIWIFEYLDSPDIVISCPNHANPITITCQQRD